MNQAQALYRLQQSELTIQRARQRIKEIDADLSNNEELQNAQKQLDKANATLQPLQNKQKDLELQIQSTLEKRKVTEAHLYSGNVKNPKEMTDMQQEIESLNRWHAELEDRLLETLLMVEEAQQQVDTAHENLAHVEARVGEQHQDLISEKASLTTEINENMEKRTGLLDLITPENKTRYNNLKPRKANQPVSVLNGTTCTICGVAQIDSVAQAVKRGDEIVTCKNCGRILVYIR